MKQICFISARGGSKGVKQKNIRILGDKPLIAHAIISAKESGLFDAIVVSTEDEEIARISKNYGADVPFMRPTELATDNTTTDQVLLHGIQELKHLGYEFDVVALRDCTVPFIDKNDIRGAIDLLKKSDCNAVFTAVKAHPNPYFGMMEVNSKGYLEISKPYHKEITRRQDAPIVFIVDGLFVFYTRSFLDTKKLFSDKVLPYEISKEHGHMIDFEFDFKVAELLYNDMQNNH
jgi:N-acylneuraminate cytidylyltransferase/CMP-N,N'-diacetyllegionaminic acid synthase